MPEFRDLERQVVELQREQADDAPGSDSRARLAELGAEVSQLRDEVAQLRGAVEEAKYVAQQALDRPVAGREIPGGLSGQSPPDATAPLGGAAVASPGSPAEVREYEAAFRVYRAGDYATAIERFQEFLDTYAESSYADNALFWIGECHYKLGDYELAAVTWDRVAKEYPEENKVPDALYRQGVALMAIGERKSQQATYDSAAREVFERIVTEYPNSDRIGEARRQLEKLER